MHGVLHHALKDAEQLQLVPRNVCDHVDPPRVTKRPMLIYTPEQVDTLLEAARTHRLDALYVLEVTTGLRINELLALKWADVDLAAGFMQVRPNRSRRVSRIDLAE